jgi:hypothetical protein
MQFRDAIVAAGTAALFLGATTAQAKRIAFIGCPVMRDMQSPSTPCWLARDGDKLYFLGLQTDTIPPVPFYSPQLLHRALVEAEVIEGAPEVCGGIATKNARASVLPELAPECDELLPQGDVLAPPPVKPSAPFRKGMRLAIAPPGTPPVPSLSSMFKAPVPPFEAKSFTIDFAFDEDFIFLDDSFTLAQAVRYLEGIEGSRITLEIPRDRVKLSDGQLLKEAEATIDRRENRLRGILQEWGVPAEKVAFIRPKAAHDNNRVMKITVLP